MERLVEIIEREFKIKPKVKEYPNGMFCIYSSDIENEYLEIFIDPYINKDLIGSYIEINYLTNIHSRYFDIVNIDPHIINIELKYKYNNYLTYKKLNNIFMKSVKKYTEKILENIKEKNRVFEIIISARFPTNYNYYNCSIKVIADFCNSLNKKDFETVFKNCVNVVKNLEDLIIGKNIPTNILLV